MKYELKAETALDLGTISSFLLLRIGMCIVLAGKA